MSELTLGIEEEYQIIDPETRELRSLISQLIHAHQPLSGIELQEELHQSVLEVATGICANVAEARHAVIQNRRAAARAAERVGMRIAAASTHPFSRWQEQTTTPNERYNELVSELEDVARANLIFGMIFKRLPRTGIPGRFESYGELERFIETLVKTGCIDDGRRIWWDVRPHPRFSTLEVRVCDIPTRVDDVVTLAALIQAVVAKLVRLHRSNLSFAHHRVAFIQENKWRAARYGVRGKLIDFRKQKEVALTELVEELLAFVDDVVDELGSRAEVEAIRRIAREGTSADRQLEVFDETGGDFQAVVDHILDETLEGVH